MNEIHLVLTDLDGTLVQPESNLVSDEVAASVREGEEQGIKFAAVTGRTFNLARDLLKTVGFQDPCIFEGGALIMNPATEEILWSKALPVDTTKLIVEKLLMHASIIEYGAGAKRPEDIEISSIDSSALSIWASVPVEVTDKVVENISRLPGVAVHANAGPGGDFSRTGIQVTHFEADKEHAVHELLRLMGVDKVHTLAIGDGNNDLPLLKNAAVKVAMGNASDELKAAADHVVGSVTNNGFAEAVRDLALS